MATLTETQILNMRKAKGVIVPKLLEMFEKPVDINRAEDVDFIGKLAMTGVWRESGREYKPMFSPSALGSCMRKVYLQKHWKELGFERVEMPNPEAHGVFALGDWIHLRIQFYLYRLSLHNPNFELLACEVPVESKKGDHGGTLDVVCISDGVPYIVDIKGLNFRGVAKIIKGEVSPNYLIQVPDYIMLYNTSRQPHVMELRERTGPIATGILLVESKAGPDRENPLALHEVHLDYSENLPRVQSRLEALRAYEKIKQIPDAECDSTRSYQFTGCAFAEHCRKEVRERQRLAREREAESKNPAGFRVRVPQRRRANRTR